MPINSNQSLITNVLDVQPGHASEAMAHYQGGGVRVAKFIGPRSMCAAQRVEAAAVVNVLDLGLVSCQLVEGDGNGIDHAGRIGGRLAGYFADISQPAQGTENQFWFENRNVTLGDTSIADGLPPLQILDKLGTDDTAAFNFRFVPVQFDDAGVEVHLVPPKDGDVGITESTLDAQPNHRSRCHVCGVQQLHDFIGAKQELAGPLGLGRLEVLPEPRRCGNDFLIERPTEHALDMGDVALHRTWGHLSVHHDGAILSEARRAQVGNSGEASYRSREIGQCNLRVSEITLPDFLCGSTAKLAAEIAVDDLLEGDCRVDERRGNPRATGFHEGAIAAESFDAFGIGAPSAERFPLVVDDRAPGAGFVRPEGECFGGFARPLRHINAPFRGVEDWCGIYIMPLEKQGTYSILSFMDNTPSKRTVDSSSLSGCTEYLGENSDISKGGVAPDAPQIGLLQPDSRVELVWNGSGLIQSAKTPQEHEVGQLYFVCDLRQEFSGQPYITFWRPKNSNYAWPLPWSGEYTIAELKPGYHEVRKGRYFERFAVPIRIAKSLATLSKPGQIDDGPWPVVANTAANRKTLRAARVDLAARLPSPSPAPIGVTR